VLKNHKAGIVVRTPVGMSVALVGPRFMPIVCDAVHTFSSTGLKYTGGCRQVQKSLNRLQGAELHDPVLLPARGQFGWISWYRSADRCCPDHGGLFGKAWTWPVN